MSDPSNPYEPAPPVSGGQGPGPGSPYGAPMQPAGYGAPPPPVGPAPSSVVNATRLMFVSAALGVIGLIVLLASKNSLRDQVAKKNPEYDAHKLDTVVNAAVAVGIVLGVIFIVLYVLLALQVRGLDPRDPKNCLAAFKSNNPAAFVLFLGLAADAALRAF